jgi:hypothetical protein
MYVKDLPEPAQKANELVDLLIDCLQVRNDAGLSRAMKVAPPVISKIRHGKLPIGAAFIVAAHELTGVSVRNLKRVAGMPCREQIQIQSA